MINEFGKVIAAQIIQSTLNDTMLEKDITELIRSWEFCPIKQNGDLTEVIYPFVFSQ